MILSKGHIGHFDYQDSGATNTLVDFSTENNSRSVKIPFEEKFEENNHVDMEKREIENPKITNNSSFFILRKNKILMER